MRARGFTLIELLVTMAILALVLGFAVPNLAAALRQTRMATVINTVSGAVAMARTAAVTRMRGVSVCPLDGSGAQDCDLFGEWRYGVLVFLDRNQDGALTLPDDQVLRQLPLSVGDLDVRSNLTAVIFNTDGTTDTTGSGMWQVCDPSQRVAPRGLRLAGIGHLQVFTPTSCGDGL